MFCYSQWVLFTVQACDPITTTSILVFQKVGLSLVPTWTFYHINTVIRSPWFRFDCQACLVAQNLRTWHAYNRSCFVTLFPSKIDVDWSWVSTPDWEPKDQSTSIIDKKKHKPSTDCIVLTSGNCCLILTTIITYAHMNRGYREFIMLVLV